MTARSAEPLFCVVRHRCAGQFGRRIATAHEKPLQIAVLEESRFRPLLTADRQNPCAIFVLKMGMNVGQEDLTNPILDKVDEVQAELILDLESIGMKTQDFPIVGDADQQRPSLGIQESRDRFKRGYLNLVIDLPGVEIHPQRRFEFHRARFAARNQISDGDRSDSGDGRGPSGQQPQA